MSFQNLKVVALLSVVASLSIAATPAEKQVDCKAVKQSKNVLPESPERWAKSKKVENHCSALEHYRSEAARMDRKATEYEEKLKNGRFFDNPKLPISPGTRAHAEYFAKQFRSEASRYQELAVRQELEGKRLLNADSEQPKQETNSEREDSTSN
jgi:hypothetical protein